ncbi:MAG: type I pullulanase [Lachnospiraceae bacterium]|nr:type I pullulanase [Lachnospiraceae bacterium]
MSGSLDQVYKGNDLGAVYTKERTTFRVWIPTAEEVELRIYPDGVDSEPLEVLAMKPDAEGTWLAEKTGDCQKLFYTYHILQNGVWTETIDVYAKAAGVNGKRGMVVDLRSTDPAGFSEDAYQNPDSVTDLVVYEVSVRDFSADDSSGIRQKGQFLGMVESGTHNATGEKTGMDYVKELGITHVQLMPVYDFGSVDESKPLENQYNWGYDPINYNLPEGSYASDAYDGSVRIRQMKEMIQTFHENGIGVIMDVVYNHTYSGPDSCLHKTIPFYYHRTDETGFTDGSGCGNEIASERSMVRKMIIDSLCYWVQEYHIDGFRFDLMAVLDQETMREAKTALKKIRPDVVLYGEGWTGGPSALPENRRSLKAYMKMLPQIGAFSDDCRDVIRGDVFVAEGIGFAGGAPELEELVRFAVVGATEHPEVTEGLYSDESWAAAPGQSVNYVSCHDNFSLWDKLAVSLPDLTVDERKAVNRLAAAMVFMCQGMPFLLSGEEMLRSKVDPVTGQPVENSFNVSVEINSMKWNLVHENADIVEYYRGLIAFRKAHQALRMTKTEQIQKYLRFSEVKEQKVVAYKIEAGKVGDTAERLFVIFNANKKKVQVPLPDQGTWKAYIDGTHAGTEALYEVQGSAEVLPVSALVLIQ